MDRNDSADREVIDTAHRMIMNERHCNVDAARRILREQGFASGEHLATIARRMIDDGHSEPH